MPKPFAASTLVLGILALAACIYAWWYLQQPLRTVDSQPAAPGPVAGSRLPESTPRPPRTVQEAIAQGKTPETSPLLRAAPERPALVAVAPVQSKDVPRSPLADDLLKPNKTGAQDLEVVFNLFEHYRATFGAFPTGEDNATIVNALTGNNPQRMAIIERHHPAINARGEMVDRWTTPFFFHFQAHDALEVRSAGPDREMYTADDLLRRSPSLEQGEPAAAPE